MGNARFLYDNLITTETMITVSSLRAGLVTGALKDGTGSAELNPSGNYSGAVDREYIIEIDDTSGGHEIGDATFRWSDGGAGWNASGVATAASGVILGYGITIGWTAGAGNDFEDGDRWYFKGINLFNPGKMLDRDRDTRYRSDELESPNTITIDLGSAQEVTALALYDHNFTSGATILLEADAAATFDSDGGSAEYSEAVTWASGKILHFLGTATTKRYWRLSVTDAANTDGYIEIGELFLGPYLELTKNFVEGYREDLTLLMESNTTPYGIRRKRYLNTQRVFEHFFAAIPTADADDLRDLIDGICDRSTGTARGFFFVPDSAEEDFWLVEITEGIQITHRTRALFDVPLRMIEVVSSV